MIVTTKKPLSLLLAVLLMLFVFSSCVSFSKLDATNLKKLETDDGYIYLRWDGSEGAAKITDGTMEAYRLDSSTNYKSIRFSTRSEYNLDIIDGDGYVIDDGVESWTFKRVYTSDKNDFIIFENTNDPGDMDEAMCFYTKEINDNMVAFYTSDNPEPYWDTSSSELDSVIAELEAFRDPAPSEKRTTAATQTQTTAMPEQTTAAVQIDAAQDNPAEGSAIVYPVGTHILFGTYEQDNNTANGKEPVEWIVLEQSGNQYLILCATGIASMQYNNTAGATSWQTCSLRSWLNNSFYYEVFSPDEQACALTDRSPLSDKVFCLSVDEILRYFPNVSSRYACASKSAIVSGAYQENGYCGWWLRDTGDNASVAARVNMYGEIVTSSSSEGGVERRDYVVRPAMWVTFG